MLLKSFTLLTAIVTLVTASPFADADPLAWGKATPQAEAAAMAFADAYAEAVAIAHPDPYAYALAASADDCATIACHAACGYLILDGAACSTNTTDTYSGPYNTTCLCEDGSKFMQRYPSCMECGWTLWKYYGPYVTEALEACSTLSTEPTGTLRCSTTLSESYTKDANAGCAYGGVCTSTSSGSSNSTSSATKASGSSSIASNTGSAESSATAKSSGGSSSGSVSAAETGSSSSSADSSSSSAGSSSAGSSSSSQASGAHLIAAGSSVVGAFLLALMI